MAGLVPADTLKDYIGKDMGASDWLKVDQDRINPVAYTHLTLPTTLGGWGGVGAGE